MAKKESELSMEMYHRIYRLAMRKINSNQIAATLDLPVSTVKNVIKRFFADANKRKVKGSDNDIKKRVSVENEQSYLDIYFPHKARFSVVDLNGMVTKKFDSRLKTVLDDILSSNKKIVALRMAHVKSIDNTGLSTILSFYSNFLAKGRYAAILDPSTKIESFIKENELENNIPIFGTEKALEEHALKIKAKKKLSGR